MQSNYAVSVSDSKHRFNTGLPLEDDSKVIATEFLGTYADVVRGLGGDPDVLLRECGIDPSKLHQAGEKISLRATAELLEHSALVLRCADFGLRLAERRESGPSIMKPIERLICNAPTIGESIHYTTCHMGAYSSGVRASLQRLAGQQMRFFLLEVLLDDFAVHPQMMECLALLTHNSWIMLSGGVARAREVWFSHLRISRISAYTKRFGTTVKFGQAFDGVFLKDADFHSKIVHGDPNVFVFESRSVAARFPPNIPGIEVEVRQAIARALAEADCTRERVAESLGMHSRTLQRRLCRIGLSFELIRDEVRRELAVRYLSRSDLGLTEIVGRLGYSEPAVLSRSCRRWFAATPSELRRNLMR